jgi:leucyl aminopeptidase
MDIRVHHGDLTKVACDLLIVNLFAGVTQPGGGTGAVDRALDGWISELIAQDSFKGKVGGTLIIPTHGKIPAKRVLLIGLGEAKDFDLEQIRRVAATAIKQAKEFKAKTVATIVHGAGIAGLPAAPCAEAVAIGSLLAAYSFDTYKSKKPDEPTAGIDTLIIVEHDAAKLADVEAGVARGRTLGDAANMARDLANEPPDIMNPFFLAHQAAAMAAEHGLACEVWDEQRIAEERMNCLLLVGRGSHHPPKFIRIDYTPDGTPRKRICLVGKGLCYDSGGYSLKPSEFMRHMKTDMTGAAVVLAVLKALSVLRPDVAVTGLIPACENLISGHAYKVDDVLRARNGKTIEIDNTDAEGRLVLADALSYAAEQDFDAIIDIATLTGGCIIALAHIWTGIMGTDQPLIDSLIAAGQTTGERMWPLPFDDEVKEMMTASDIADLRNSAGREGSAMQGGIFLREFAGDTPWAHLDIAGTSFLDAGAAYLARNTRTYLGKGPTGIPVRALVEYIERL